MSEKDPKRWRWGRWLGLLVGGAALLAWGGYLAHTRRVAADLASAIAELDALDPDWRIDDLLRSRADLLPEDNSITRMRAIWTSLPPKWPDHARETVLEKVAANRLPDAGERAALDASLAGTPREAARDLIRFPRGRFDIVYPRNPMSVVLPDHSKTREVARLLELDAWQRSLDGQPDEALLSTRACLNVSRALEDDPTLIGHMTRYSLLRVAFGAIERTLALGEPSEKALAELANDLAREPASPPMTFALRAERANTHAILREITTGSSMPALFDSSGPRKWLTSWQMLESARREHPTVLRFMTRIVEASRLPDARQLEAGDALDREVKASGGEFARMLLPSFTKITGSDRRARCGLMAMRTLVAVERYRIANRAWPATLEDLVPAFADRVPEDPIDGKPVRYRRTPEGVMVYSIGNDRKDDGGDIDKPFNDIGYRLWDADKRRSPP